MKTRHRSDSDLSDGITERAAAGEPHRTDSEDHATPIQRCVRQELQRYFEMLDGEEPAQLYRMVVRQAEEALLETVMQECRGNQTRAALWLGISRGNLRNKLSNMNRS